jgi:uncharacterized protein YbjT (DUF2867 family)
LPISPPEQAQKLSTVTGKPIRYVNVSPEEAKKAQLAAGVPPFLADGLSELFAERRRGKRVAGLTNHSDSFRVAPDQL